MFLFKVLFQYDLMTSFDPVCQLIIENSVSVNAGAAMFSLLQRAGIQSSQHHFEHDNFFVPIESKTCRAEKTLMLIQ